MNLSVSDLNAIKQLFTGVIDDKLPAIIDERVDLRVPGIIDERVQPMLNRLESRMTSKLDLGMDQLALDVGRFSLETTNNFRELNAHIDDIDDGLARLSEMTDNNHVELMKLKLRPKSG